MKITTLEEAFVKEISDIYSAEKQITKALPKMAKAASNPELADGFKMHLEETHGQIERLEKFAKKEGITFKRVKCKAMEGLSEEGDEVIEEIEKGAVRDAMLIIGGQKVEHYEIASYGSLIALCSKLGYDPSLLEENLEEEKATDLKLNELALADINDDASDDDEEEKAPRSSRKRAA